jgi:hypothetical protein
LREIPARDRANHALDLANRFAHVGHQIVDRVDAFGPAPHQAGERRALVDLALLAHRGSYTRKFVSKLLVLINDLVEQFGDALGLSIGGNGSARGKVPAFGGFQDADQLALDSLRPRFAVDGSVGRSFLVLLLR